MPATPPMPAADDDLAVLAEAHEWLVQGARVALATVVETWGSAPRAVGAHLAIRADGLFRGSVSGGCVEGDVIAEAERLLSARASGHDSDEDAGAARMLAFGVTNERAWATGLACGGRIRILLEDVTHLRSTLRRILDAARARRTVLRWREIPEGGQGVIEMPADAAALVEPPAPFLRTPEGRAAIAQVAHAGGVEILDDGSRGLVLQAWLPAPRLVIVGAVHIAARLAPMARALGFAVEVVDPRGAFVDAFRPAPPENGRGDAVAVIEDWPDEHLARAPLDAASALVALTHDPKLDDAAIGAALRSPAFHIGALGSRRTHAARLARLRRAGFDDRQLARIHGPVGLDIGARGPGEIALAILAELVAVRRAAPPAGRVTDGTAR